MESERIKKTTEYHAKQYNCAQAVACAYCDLFDVDIKDAFKSMEGFGRGMGAYGTCGALSAVAYLTGLANSTADLENPSSKALTYELMEEAIKKFEGEIGSIICHKIKGLDKNPEEPLKSCDYCIETAARIVEEMIIPLKK